MPNNATIAIVGDFDTRDAQALVQQYLGRVPKGGPVPRDIPKEPVQTAERVFDLQEDWPLPAVIVAYHTAADATPDAYPTHVLDKILGDGDSSRLLSINSSMRSAWRSRPSARRKSSSIRIFSMRSPSSSQATNRPTCSVS